MDACMSCGTTVPPGSRYCQHCGIPIDASDEGVFAALINVQSYGDQELRSLKNKLEKEEREISKRRRILQGQIEILRAETVRRLRDEYRAGEGMVSD